MRPSAGGASRESGSASTRRYTAPSVCGLACHADPSAAIMDSQSVQTMEEAGGIKGYDWGKQVKGRQRPLLVDTLGLLLSVEVTPANTSDQAGARPLLVGLTPLQPRLELIWADSAYRGEPLAPWCATEGAWRLEIIQPGLHMPGFVVRPWCWIGERALRWLGRQRRLSKDDEWKVQTSETLLKLAMIQLMVRTPEAPVPGAAAAGDRGC